MGDLKNTGEMFMNLKNIFLGTCMGVLLLSLSSACSRKTVYFANIKEGDQLQSPFKVKMEIKGMEVRPAGEIKEDTGHHHILINKGPLPKGQVIPTDENHRHFGGGQSEAELELPPGKYKLTLQFADGIHRSYGPELSKSIEIIVK